MLRFLKSSLLVIVTVLTLVGIAHPVLAADLPDQLVKFLPPNPDVLMVVPSVNDLETSWNEIRLMMADLTDESDDPIPTFDDLLMMGGPEFSAMIDPDRPLALALTVPSMMSGQEPTFCGVIPVKDNDLDTAGLAILLGLPTIVQNDGYALLSQALDFEPATQPTTLLNHLSGHTISVSANLKNLWTNFSPMLDFALMAMSAPKPPAEGETAPAQPEMNAEQTAAMGNMVRNVMQSADVLSMGLDFRNGRIFFTEEFTILSGTPLAPPPQPDFNEALELTRFLPRDSDWIMAYAVELGSIIDIYKEFYLVSLEESFAMMGDTSTLSLDSFLDLYFQVLDMALAPTAMALDLSSQEFSSQLVMKSSDIQELVDLQLQMIEQVNLGMPWLKIQTVSGLEIDGNEVLAWDFDWDVEAMMAMAGPAAQDDGSKAEELAAMITFFERFIPGARMLSKDDLLFVSYGTELEPLQKMVQQAKQSRGAVHPELAQLAAAGGPSCQGVFTGDLASMMTMIFEITEEISGEDLPALKLDPIPMQYVMRIDEHSYGVDYEFGLQGLGKFIAAMEEFDVEEEEAVVE